MSTKDTKDTKTAGPMPPLMTARTWAPLLKHDDGRTTVFPVTFLQPVEAGTALDYFRRTHGDDAIVGAQPLWKA